MNLSDTFWSYVSTGNAPAIQTLISDTTNQTTLVNLGVSKITQQAGYYIALFKSNNYLSTVPEMITWVTTNSANFAPSKTEWDVVVQLLTKPDITLSATDKTALENAISTAKPKQYFVWQTSLLIDEYLTDVQSGNLNSTALNNIKSGFETYFFPNLPVFMTMINDETIKNMFKNIFLFYTANFITQMPTNFKDIVNMLNLV